LVENDDADVFLFRRALGKHDFHGTVRVVTTINGAQCYLSHEGGFKDGSYYPRPDIIVCDMHLGGRLGTELLEWVRQRPDLAEIPFVFLSGSYLPPEKVRARELGADAFYHKSGDIQQATEHAEHMLQLLRCAPAD
jgi:CheY-like chemotaxis protein